MFMSFVAYAIGTKFGRYLTLGVLGLVTFLVFLQRVYSSGRERERAKQIEDSLNNLRTRVKVDEEIHTLPPDERRKRLDKWLHD